MGHGRVGDSPVAETPVAGIPVQVMTAGTPVARTAADQASPAVDPPGRRVVRSPDNAPDVVAHGPILSIGGVFLNVPRFGVA